MQNSHQPQNYRIAVDPLFPGPENLGKRPPPCDVLPEFKYTLVFDERIDSLQIPRTAIGYHNGAIIEMNEEDNKSFEEEDEVAQ